MHFIVFLKNKNMRFQSSVVNSNIFLSTRWPGKIYKSYSILDSDKNDSTFIVLLNKTKPIQETNQDTGKGKLSHDKNISYLSTYVFSFFEVIVYINTKCLEIELCKS